MSAKEKRKLSTVVSILCVMCITLIIIYIKFINNKETYATRNLEEPKQEKTLKISNNQGVDLNEIISNNTNKKHMKEEIYEKQEELEYITKYRNNSELYKGTTQISQEGRNGIQTIIMKKTYNENGDVIKDEQVACIITKSSINKIIDIGTRVYIEPQKEKDETKINYGLAFDMKLNQPSGFSLEQFKKVLSDEKDKNKIFANNAEYFYYIEDEYNINGLFIASIAIHESAWGTSNISKKKYNLFGYGAYDSNPYNGAYSFESYAESIDLIARVLVKYYLNPAGTKIYDGQIASGKYYNGNTLSDVNKRYATDKNWANAVYKYMRYLYEKI